VTCIDFQAERVRLLRAGNQPLQLRFELLFVTKAFCKLSRVQFNELAPRPRRRFDLFCVRRNEQADFDPAAVHLFARLCQRLFIGENIKSALSCHFLPAFGHEADNFRLELQGDAHDFRRAGHFQIEPGPDDFAQFPDITVLDMPAVFAQMGGDAVRARRLARERRRNGIRLAVPAPAVPRFANRCDVVYINTQFKHRNIASVPNLAGFGKRNSIKVCFALVESAFVCAVSKFRSFVKYWLPVIVWMAVIFSASGDAKSYQHSSRIIAPIVRWLFPDISPEALDLVVLLVRKCAHLTEYAVLALLFWRAMRRPVKRDPRPWSEALAGRAILFVALYAASDEFHQLFVATRDASLRDVAIDTFGAALGIFMLWGRYCLRKRR
jgi:VanZ family protein